MSKTAHPVVLTVPRGSLGLSAMRMVIGWVASCNDLRLDQIDDINLAVETVVAGESEEGDPLSLTLSTHEGVLSVLVAGLKAESLRANLEADEHFKPTLDWPLDVRIFLSALLDDYDVVEDSTGSFGVMMQKRMR